MFLEVVSVEDNTLTSEGDGLGCWVPTDISVILTEV